MPKEILNTERLECHVTNCKFQIVHLDVSGLGYKASMQTGKNIAKKLTPTRLKSAMTKAVNDLAKKHGLKCRLKIIMED